MAIYINTLNGGNITVGSGGSVLDATKTRFTLQNGTVETANITGTLDRQQMSTNGYYDGENYEWLKTITRADIGNTVTSIGQNAFSGCSGLTSVTIPDSVTSIGENAFWSCTSLTSITIPDSVQSITAYSFADSSSITSVTITSNGGNAESVKQMIIDAIGETNISDFITWNMPS